MKAFFPLAWFLTRTTPSASSDIDSEENQPQSFEELLSKARADFSNVEAMEKLVQTANEEQRPLVFVFDTQGNFKKYLAGIPRQVIRSNGCYLIVLDKDKIDLPLARKAFAAFSSGNLRDGFVDSTDKIIIDLYSLDSVHLYSEEEIDQLMSS